MVDPATDSITLAVVVSRLDDIKEDMSGMRSEIQDFKKDTVSRGEWVQRNNHVDERFKHTDDKFNAQGREIANMRTEMQSKRAPWWSVGSLIIAAAALLNSFFGQPIP